VADEKNDRFLRACRRQPVDTVPVWIMRQAGRYLPSYREVRKHVTFLELCRTPELAARVTLMPVEQLGVDAAILFSDILIPVEPMGIGLVFTDAGPSLDGAIRNRGDVDRLRVPTPEEDMPFVLQAVRLLRRELEGKVPLIGFAGAPLTLAAYMTEGGGSTHFTQLKRLLFADPAAAHALLDKITDTVAAYLAAQVAAGAEAVQLFDSWAGVLSPAHFDEFALPYVQRVVAAVRQAGEVPFIYFVNGIAGLLGRLRGCGADVIGFDWRVDIGEVRARLGDGVAVQGNLDPCVLLGPEALIDHEVERVLAAAGTAPGHIFNLGHGILPETPPEHARRLVEAVHRLGRRAAGQGGDGECGGQRA